MRGFFLFLILMGVFSIGETKPLEKASTKTEAGINQPVPDIVVGRNDAPVKIIEYSSLTCTHCAKFHKTVLPILHKKYIKTGKVQLVFRHFPIDSYALKASAVVISAPPIRQFSLVNHLFATQDQWIGNDCEKVLSRIIGGSLEGCQKILNDRVLADRVLMARLKAEKEMKIEATPTFIVNGRVIDYAPSLDEIDQLIQRYLGAHS